MKQILLLVDQKGVNSNALKFACNVTAIGQGQLIALYYNKKSFVNISVPSGTQGGAVIEDKCGAGICCEMCKQKSRIEFQATCTKMGISWKHNPGLFRHLDDVIEHTRFCDLLIMSAELNFDEDQDVYSTRFTEQLLHRSECPVLIAPLEPQEIKTVVFAYDGSASAAYAMRQFTLLFSPASNLDAKVLIINYHHFNEVQEQQIEKISSYLQLHFRGVEIIKMEGDPTDEIPDEITEMQDTILVTGSFGRSAVSYKFRPSVAEPLLKKMLVSVFVAHQ